MTDQFPFIVIHELINPETGNTYKQDNLAKSHNIPIGTLVETVPDDDDEPEEDEEDWRGVRLHVIGHGRDCDGTPLYTLGIKGDRWTGLDGGLGNRAWGGWPEDGLRVVTP